MTSDSYPRKPGWREPETSKDAAADVGPTADNLRSLVLLALRVPRTVHETAAILGLPVPTIQPRFSELRKLGEIAPSGERRQNATGSMAHVWRVTTSRRHQPAEEDDL